MQMYKIENTMPRKPNAIFASDRELLAQLGARLRLARLRRKLSLAAVAGQAGISRATLYSVESGGAASTIGTYLRVLGVLGLQSDIAAIAAEDVPGREAQDLRLKRRSVPKKVAPAVPKELVKKASRTMRDAQRRRPRSLKEVALWGAEQGDTDSFLREFLDEFYVAAESKKRAAMLRPEPPLLANEKANAYLGAVAEHLALRNKLPIPVWTARAPRFLHTPYFPGGLESLKATMLKESPTAFRRRMIFVGADPLYRPRRDTVALAT
jgi:transcriptional regulator with XRE-family HTH domain